MTKHRTVTPHAGGEQSPGRVAGTPARRRWRRLMSLAAVSSLAMVGLAASPSQAQVTVCDQHVRDVVVFGAIEVPAGQACGLTNVTVVGDVNVEDGADLVLDGTTVAGALTVASDGFAHAQNSLVALGTTLGDAFGLSAVDSTLSTGVEVNGAVVFLSDRTNHVGDVVSTGGWTFIRDALINGEVHTTGDVATDLFRTNVSGNVTVDQAETGTMICQLNIDGVVSATNGGGVIQIGGPQPNPSCGSNVLGGLQVHDNSGTDIQISSNVVVGAVDCTGNTPEPVGFGNLFFGRVSGQCTLLGTAREGELIPPPDHPAEEEAATEEERAAEIEELVADRLAAAKKALGIS